MYRHAIMLSLILLGACGSAPTLDRETRQDPFDAGPMPATAREPDLLRITILDVGQGDAAMIEAPSGEAVLIDAGPPGAGVNVIIPFLASRGIAELSHVFLTHFHEDHTGGLCEVAADSDSTAGTDDDIILRGGIHDRGIDGANEGDLALFECLPPGADTRQTAYPGDRIQLGDLSLEVMAAGGRLKDGTAVDPGDPPDENALSIALLVEYGAFRMLFTGDLTGGGGDPPYQTPDLETPLAPLVGDIDALKVAHHGSKTSTNQAFLDVVQPEIAVISVGDGNDFFHPHPSVIERLLASGATIYQTERGALFEDGPIVANGPITIEVDAEGDYKIVLQ